MSQSDWITWLSPCIPSDIFFFLLDWRVGDYPLWIWSRAPLTCIPHSSRSISFLPFFPPQIFHFFFFSFFSVSTETEHFVDKFKRPFFQLRNKGLGHDEEPAGMKKYKWRCEREARLHFALSCASFHFFRQGSTARAVLIRHSSVFSSSWLSVMKFHRNFCLQKENTATPWWRQSVQVCR